MKNLLLFCFLVALTISVAAQEMPTDGQILEELLGKNVNEINPTLDKLKAWYHFHYKPNASSSGDDNKPRMYSIADGDGHAKVWEFTTNNKKVITQIMINFRHDDKAQVIDMEKIKPPVEFHVGLYSTDYTYKSK